MGDAPYRELLDEAEKRCPDERRLRSLLSSISNPEARNLIFEKALEASDAEISPDDSRTDLLDWLARIWKIQVDIQPEAEG